MKELSRRGFMLGAAVAAAGAATAGLTACSPSSNKSDNGVEAASEEDGAFSPGSYVGVGQGRGGQIVVEVTLSASKIEGIQVVSHSETPIISDAPLSLIPQRVIKNQSLAVDTVTHATLSSMGVLDAITNAMNASGCDTGSLRTQAQPDPVTIPPFVESDIAVVGGGCCGLAAVIRAAQLGVPTVLFEQSSHLGGDALFAEGWALGAGTLMQKAAGIQDSGEQCWQDLVDNANPNSQSWYDEELSRTYHLNTGRTIDWLDQYVGVHFDSREVTRGTYGGGAGFAPRIHFTNGGVNLIQPMVNKVNEAVRDHLATFVYRAEVTRILTDETGAVSGVEVRDEQGNLHEHPFKAVLLATGGYHQNREMVEKYLGPNYVSGGGSTSTGSGFAICESMGFELTNMNAMSLVYAGGIPSSMGMDFTIQYFAEAEYPGVVWIDKHGKRNFNETANRQASHAAWKAADEQIMNIVMPASSRLAYRGLILRDGDQDVPFTPKESWDMFDKMLEEGKYVFEADTPEELAEKLEVDDVEAFVSTLSEINACIDSGQPDSLGRTSFPRFEGKLYGVKTFAVMHNTNGGVKRNANFQPITPQGECVEGLYAGGSLCGIGLVNPATKTNVLGGGTGVGGCPNQGRIVMEAIIRDQTGMETELPEYEFEGDAGNYEIDVFEPGGFVYMRPVIEA